MENLSIQDDVSTVMHYYWTPAFIAFKDRSTDVILRTPTKDIHTHRLLLMATSDYFDKYFTQHPTTDVVNIPEDPVIVQAYVDSLYTCDLDDDQLTRITVPVDATVELIDFLDYYMIHIQHISIRDWQRTILLTGEEYGEIYPRLYRVVKNSKPEVYNTNWLSFFLSSIFASPILTIILPENDEWDWLLNDLPNFIEKQEFDKWVQSDKVQNSKIREFHSSQREDPIIEERTCVGSCFMVDTEPTDDEVPTDGIIPMHRILGHHSRRANLDRRYTHW